MKQCGTCKFWDIKNIRVIIGRKISDCLSGSIESESFVEVDINEFEIYPMLEIEGYECHAYQESKE